MKKIFAMLVLIALFCHPMAVFAESKTEYEELAKGSKGNSVKLLQERLKELGYYTIAVDGDYGNGTVNAINAFQARNGLEQSGTASIELQQLIFSDDARKAPKENPVTITNLAFKNAWCTYRINNKSGESIDTVRVLIIPYGNDGSVLTDKAISFDQNVLTKDWGVSETIKHNGKGMTINVNDNYIGYELKVANKFAVGIISYHTASGNTVVYEPEDVTFYITDGTMQYPSNDEVEPYIYSDAKAAEISGLRTGLTTKNIYPFTAEFYGTNEGLYILDVAGNSLGDRAGFEPGDIVTQIDGKNSILISAQHEAAQKLLNGESVKYTYLRNGQSHAVDVYLDMESAQTQPSSENAPTIGDELLKYGELLERSLITQAEYDALKEKLIFG